MSDPEVSCFLCNNPRADAPRVHVGVSVRFPSGSGQDFDAHATCVAQALGDRPTDDECPICRSAAPAEDGVHLTVHGAVGTTANASVHPACFQLTASGPRS